MKKDPSWGEVILAFALVVISFIAIAAFLVFPYVKGKIANEKENTSNVSGEVSISSADSDTLASGTGEEQPGEISVEPYVPPVVEIPEDVQKIKWEKVEHPDITDCDIVLIGDSIFAFGFDEYPYSTVATFLEEYSGTRVYNLSVPGMCAVTSEGAFTISQQEAVKNFINLTQTEDENASLFNSELGRFANDDHTGRQLIVIMDCTINDYFMNSELSGNAYDENCYFGALTNCISWIFEENPYAIVCYIRTHSILHGTQGYDFNQAQATYNMYKEQMIAACNYEGAFCITCDSDNGINYDNAKEYLEDGTHLNMEGRKLEAKIISHFIIDLLPYY